MSYGMAMLAFSSLIEQYNMDAMPYALAIGAYAVAIKASSWTFKPNYTNAMLYYMATQASSLNFHAHPLDIKAYASMCNAYAVGVV